MNHNPVLTLTDVAVATADKVLVKDLNLAVSAGSWSALIGESGSGKTMTALAIIGQLPYGISTTAGEILVDGQNWLNLSAKKLRHHLGKEVAYVAQDPASAFTPYLRLGAQISETLRAHKSTMDVAEAFEKVSLDPQLMRRFPGELSGGQLQRASLAMAMMLNPKVLIADEPTTALDAVTQKQVLQHIDIMRQQGTAVLFITHDLRVVRRYADYVTVMRGGEVVEAGGRKSLDNPQHPYTRELISAVKTLRKDNI
ncbi:Oligopeptide transport ATP-binding protein OppD [Corynebacterium kutscheri]|uniref:ABC-type dipeptide/oligopeptide/nickel transport system, ATPase component n=1 Tax=Corynebacterium kutscheri TaxID=35755 RepID=A0A0F6R1G8_9CORY|nr:ABC transporter ATP-binding protein [Corynebacterium kutscheri]AKE41023.1 ABC-type dipeptide/oligopeptide/nickel transport system, ATPase component [Corynebacterium kutscheri]VEH06913.1 Oligopeptide transport ATP-binding protein OppD [Corynebacterium kutscheri]VEH09321.1 Oligopeptide transport ATP-binding protein OppD [Corynebacterium kutscheri]VEH79409.1 Oligopeptide transport ATP-binding protein OppD [Corynebacterium kutscheri]